MFWNIVTTVWNNTSNVLVSQERHPGDSKNYNECIRHETMRVAVCDMLEGKVPCPEALWWDKHHCLSCSFLFVFSIFSSLWYIAVVLTLSSLLSAYRTVKCVCVCVCVCVCAFSFLLVFIGVWWKSPSLNTMISMRESAKRDCIYRDRTCRWLY